MRKLIEGVAQLAQLPSESFPDYPLWYRIYPNPEVEQLEKCLRDCLTFDEYVQLYKLLKATMEAPHAQRTDGKA